MELMESLDSFFDSLEPNLIRPCKTLSTGASRCASSLKMGKDFERSPMQSLKEHTYTSIKQQLSFSKIRFGCPIKDPTVASSVEVGVLKCSLTIYEKLSKLIRPAQSESLCDRIKNEAVLRYTVGDPIMEMMCNCGDLKVQLEESVSDSNTFEVANPSLTTPTKCTTAKVFQSPSSNVAQNVTGQSHADYSCYTIRRQDQILAVIIEAKMDGSSKDAIAQVMGYVAAFRKRQQQPFGTAVPFALVITQSKIDLLLFPFVDVKDDEQHLLIAVHYDLSLWSENKMILGPINIHVLSILAFLSYNSARNISIPFPDRLEHECMRHISVISDTMSKDDEIKKRDEMIAKMQEKIVGLEKAVSRLQI